MVRPMDGSEITEIRGGANQRRVRDHNERLILSMIQRHGPMPGSEIARRAGLSPQTASIILRKLEADRMLDRGEPVRGKVGKPSVPMALNPEGVLSFGLKIGRRSADLVLSDILGTVRQQLHRKYDYPLPEEILAFLEEGLARIQAALAPAQRDRLCGVGIGIPFELWKWHDEAGPDNARFRAWKEVDLPAAIARFSELPVFVLNDATAACHAEYLFGRGKSFRDYAYFFIGSFVGGGVALNGSVYEGNQGNAGALGSIRTTSPLGESKQLIDVASLYLLERRLVEVGIDPAILWRRPQDWRGLERHVEPWIGETAQELAKASLSICSVIDFEAILIDGAFPAWVRGELVAGVRRYLDHQDMRGLIAPVIEPGSVGENARAIGAASCPIFRQFLLDTNGGPSIF